MPATSNIHILIATLSLSTAGFSQCLTESFALQENTAPAILGLSVSIHGDLAVIGAPLQQGATDWAAGRVHVYRFNGSEWELEAELVADDGASGDMLGVSVHTDGTRIVAGAWFEDTLYSNDGAAYVFFKPEDSDWIFEQKTCCRYTTARIDFWSHRSHRR